MAPGPAAPRPVSAGAPEIRDGERVIVPTSIYAPGSLPGLPDGGGHAPGAPPPAGHPAGPGPGPAAAQGAPPGYAAPPAAGYGAGRAAGRTVPPGYAPPPGPAGPPGPGFAARAYHPASPPDEETVNGGSYAYVIREEEAPARPGPRSRGNQPPPQEQSRPEPPAFIYRDPATPAVADEPPAAYGPDDPAYGPPSADWYTREDQAGQWAADDPCLARGPFEPHVAQGGPGQEPVPGLPVAGDPVSGAAMPLDQIREFYLTAAAISPENLDRHFDELLERQRELISEYFKEAGLQENAR